MALWERDALSGDVKVTFTKWNDFPQLGPYQGTPYVYTYAAVPVNIYNPFATRYGTGILYNMNIRNAFAFTRQG